ncbi:MAG: hypothetical protein KDK39_13990, partial [Leptospiraceae bacterium]|nr:hypothetical protein [Leptospiraceae bacterium]
VCNHQNERGGFDCKTLPVMNRLEFIDWIQNLPAAEYYSMPSALKKIILFDMMETLVQDPWPAAILPLLAKRRLDLDEFSAARTPDNFLRFEAGLINEYDFIRQYYRRDLRPQLRQQLPRPERIRKELYRSPIRLLSGVDALLQDLKARQPQAGFHLGLASNYSMWYPHILDQHARLLRDGMDFLFFSCEMGRRKPDIRFYQLIQDSLARRFQVTAAELQIWFADDRPENLMAPREMGWHTYQIQHRDVPAMQKALQGFISYPMFAPADES